MISIDLITTNVYCFHIKRISYNGITLASQANDTGSIPVIRSNLNFISTCFIIIRTIIPLPS